MLKVYCEHGALTKKLRAHQKVGRIELIHFPYDPDARSKHLSPSAKLSEAQWRDMNVAWNELGKVTWDEFSGSAYLEDIKSIIGASHRRDVLHVDSAHKTGCKIFITVDNDILSKKEELEPLLGMRFFHPEKDEAELESYLDCLSRT